MAGKSRTAFSKSLSSAAASSLSLRIIFYLQLINPADRHFSIFHCNDVIGIAGSEINVVDDDDDRLIAFPHEPSQDLHDLHGVLHVKIVERFIEEDVFSILGLGEDDVARAPQ